MKRVILALVVLTLLPVAAEAQCGGGGRGLFGRGIFGIRGRIQDRRSGIAGSSCGSGAATYSYEMTTTVSAAGQTLGASKTLVSKTPPQSEITLEGLAVLLARVQDQMQELNARMEAVEKSLRQP